MSATATFAASEASIPNSAVYRQAEGVTSQLKMPRAMMTSAVEISQEHGSNEIAQSMMTVELSSIDRWSNTLERRFSLLAARKAAGSIDDGEMREFVFLQKHRRRLRNPVSAKEILFQYRRRALETHLATSLKQYVEHIETENSKKA